MQHEVPLERPLKRYLVLRVLSALDLREDVHIRPRPVGTQALGHVLEVAHRRDDTLEHGVIVDRVPAARHRITRRVGAVEIAIPRRRLEIVPRRLRLRVCRLTGRL